MSLSVYREPATRTEANISSVERYCRKKSHLEARVAVVLAAIDMFQDSGRLALYAMHNCWTRRTMTPMVMNTLQRAGKYLILAISAIGIGTFFPKFFVGISREMLFQKPQGLAGILISGAKRCLKLVVVGGVLLAAGALLARYLPLLDKQTGQAFKKRFHQFESSAAQFGEKVKTSAGTAWGVFQDFVRSASSWLKEAFAGWRGVSYVTQQIGYQEPQCQNLYYVPPMLPRP